MCVLVLWARLTTVHREHMLTHTLFTNTTCEEKKLQVHRRNQGPVAVRIQLQAGHPPASRSLLVSAATNNQAPEHTPGPCAGKRDFGSRIQGFLTTSGQRRVAIATGHQLARRMPTANPRVRGLSVFIIRWIRHYPVGYAHCAWYPKAPPVTPPVPDLPRGDF